MAEKWARENKVHIIQFIPNWDEQGKRAGPIRNLAMAKYAQALIAIKLKGASNRGTEDMITKMGMLDKKIFVCEAENESKTKESSKDTSVDKIKKKSNRKTKTT